MMRAEKDPYFWATELTQTIDEQDNAVPYKPFPRLDYIKATIPVLLEEDITFIPKSRSMMASWTVALVAVWLCQTRPATGVVIQSQDEDRSKKLIEYARVLYQRSHAEWQRRHPLAKAISAQQETELAFANDSWMLAITGTPNKSRSEHPTIAIFDEAAFMDQFEECFNTVRGAHPLHVWALSSAEHGPFFDLIENAIPCDWRAQIAPKKRGSLATFLKANVKREVPGLTFGRTEKKWAVVHMHYSADPKRDVAWAAKEKLKYTSDADWRKEQEIDPYAKDGALVYPEFDENIHVIDPSQIPQVGCRYMAIDPHPRVPHAFLWVMIDKWGDWYFYRELWPSIVSGQAKSLKPTDVENRFTIRDYVETVAALEGNRIEWQYAETIDEIGDYVRTNRGENILGRYMDQAGKGFLVSNDAIEKESYWERYTTFGFSLLAPKKAIKAGEDFVRDGLKPRKHDRFGDWPKFHISSDCPELILEMKRHRYPSTKRLNLEQDLPDEGIKARRHLIDLLRYLATAQLVYFKEEESKQWNNFTA